MNEFNVLLAAATNGTPSGSLFDALFARYIAPQDSWRELESPLPITILAAGEDLIDYRIFGNTENGESVGERTVNLFDVEEITHNGYSKNNFYGQVSSNNICAVIKRFEPNTDYCVTWEFSSTSKNGVYNQMRLYATSTLIGYLNNGVVINLTQEQIDSITNVIAYFGSYNTDGYYKNFTIVQASTAPTSYVPYGYKLPMSASDGVTTTTTPIYIGSDPLAEDEYVDYGSGKIYRQTSELWDGILYNSYFDSSTFSLSYNKPAVYKSIKVLLQPGNYVLKFDPTVYLVRTLINGGYSEDSYNTEKVYFTVNSESYVGFSFRNTSNTNWVDSPSNISIRGIQPTDPPVPIPALPTAQGETIIDYNPSTSPAVEPEKMYVKYKPLHTSATIYGFRINPDEPNSSACVTYLADAVGMTPASMGATSFNYGSWKNAFFMPKPCMLKYDGTVDYYLDPNDFTKKVDGTASDVGNINYAGNAMMEFPKIWFKFEAGTANGEGYFYVSNQKVDDTYKCWCNMDADGNEIDHFYVHIYNGVIYDGKMRSLSGMKLSPWSTTAYSASATYAVGAKVNYDGKMWKCVTAVETAEEFDSTKWEQFAFNGITDGTQEVNSATANNTTAKSEWYIDTWCDRVLITALLYLMGKSLNLQGTFGRGIDSGSQSAAESYVTGAANDKGLFYGSTSNGNTVVKVFGIENFWACKWHRTAGLIGNSSGGYSYKMTVSTTDGSSVSGYNSNGNGYLTTTFNRPASNYVKLMAFGAHGTLPLNTTSATSVTYYCDYFYTGTGYALVGGNSDGGAYCGFCVGLGSAFGYRSCYVAAALSCKPCKNKNGVVGRRALPTTEGETTIEYDGGEPQPTQMYVKYRRKD